MSHKSKKLHTSRLMSLLLCVLLVLPCIPAVRAEGGSCGDNLTWSYGDGTLTISGSGAMTNYTEQDMPPWYALRKEIQRLSLPEGLTRVGDLAFYNCVNLTSVVIPSGVTTIGDAAFCQNYSLSMLTLNSGLRTIGISAFECCESLMDVRIPATVTYIGNRAFYRCRSLAYVTVPSSVTSMGDCVFSYCDNLVRAEIDASVPKVPGYTFYGCSSLKTVTVDGNPENAAELKEGVDNSGNSTGSEPVIIQPSSNNSASYTDIGMGESGEIIVNNTTVTKTENSTVSSTSSSVVENGETTTTNSVTATVVNPEGWSEVVDQVQSVQDSQTKQESQVYGQEQTDSPAIDVNIYSTGDSSVPKDVWEKLAGSNVNLTINTQSGSKYKVDCSKLDEDSDKVDIDISYDLAPATSVPEKLNRFVVYDLMFHHSSVINAEVMIRLPLNAVRKVASLYQLDGNAQLRHLQSVIVDNDGYAHFYLGSIDSDTAYLIAMEVPSEQRDEPIVPDVLYEEYRMVDQSTGKEYIITGRSSSWGMGLGQVMGILAVVMVSVIIVVGGVMFAWNKRRLRNGYVPDWDDDEYDDEYDDE